MDNATKDLLAQLGMSNSPNLDTIAGRVYATATDLAERGVFCRVDFGHPRHSDEARIFGPRMALTSGDAWADTMIACPEGMSPALAYIEDGDWASINQVEVMFWGFPHHRPDIARTLVDAFRAHGFTATWEDEQIDGVYVRSVEVRIGSTR